MTAEAAGAAEGGGDAPPPAADELERVRGQLARAQQVLLEIAVIGRPVVGGLQEAARAVCVEQGIL